MKINRLIALIAALTMTVSASSCRLRNFKDKNVDDTHESESSDSASEKSEVDEKSTKEKTTKKSEPQNENSGNDQEGYTDSSPELDDIKAHIQNLIDDSSKTGNSEAVITDVDAIINDIDGMYEDMSKLSLDYTVNWGDEDVEAEYDKAQETLTIAFNLAEYAFCRCAKIDEYADIVEPYIDENLFEEFSAAGMNMKRIEGYTKVDFEIKDEYLDRYYDIAYDDSLDDDEKDIRAAELYLELLDEYDTETFYDSFHRDYSPELVLELSETVRSEMSPACDALLDALRDTKGVKALYDDTLWFESPFEMIAEYSPQLTDEIDNAAKVINDEKLYELCSGDDSYTGSFTTFLPLENRGIVYVYDSGDYSTLSTAIHEFGHFYAYFDDTLPTFTLSENIDIAEVQSQGFEFIFTRFYDDIYGEYADVMKLVTLYNICGAVTSGFEVGEFEYTVLKNKDSMTAEEVVEKFDEIVGDDTGFHFWYVSHMFENPGYYISYGVSALAAFDIWRDEMTDGDKALDKYIKICRVSSLDSSRHFQEALDECGFENVMSEEYITELAEELIDYADNL